MSRNRESTPRLAALIPWLSAGLGLMINMTGLVYGYGKLSAKTEYNAQIAAAVAARLEDVGYRSDLRLGAIEQRLANIEGRLSARGISAEPVQWVYFKSPLSDKCFAYRKQGEQVLDFGEISCEAFQNLLASSRQ